MPPRRSPEAPRPFLKWAGGKTQLLSQFRALYPGTFTRYREPFIGSGAVFFQVQGLFGLKEAILADGNEDLINVYRVIQGKVEPLIRLLGKHRHRHGKEHYYHVRAMDPSSMTQLARAARLIYLNKTCFNGLYRVNSRGAFNVPMGRYTDPPILDAPNLRCVSEALRGVALRSGHFRDVLNFCHQGDFIYLDPPYHPISATSYFTAYTDGSFTSEDQAELSEVFRELSKRGCLLMLSNSDTPLIHRLYRGFKIRKVAARRNINSKAEKRGHVSELVVLNYDPPLLEQAETVGARRAELRSGGAFSRFVAPSHET
jgi:DNA adenine methylase